MVAGPCFCSTAVLSYLGYLVLCHFPSVAEEVQILLVVSHDSVAFSHGSARVPFGFFASTRCLSALAGDLAERESEDCGRDLR